MASAAGGEEDGADMFNSEPLPRAIGRYLLLRRIARGGMGEVFLASTTGLEGAERPVVVKLIRRDHAQDPSFIARFLDEARVQAQLTHSGVAQVLDAATDEQTGEPYAVVEHVEGKSLGDVRSRAMQLGSRIGWAESVAVTTMIAEALAHVHERKDAAGRALAIVHRDLSPQNVMVSYGGDIKVIDFGTARGHNRRCHTVAGVVFAKPGYVAPEVANGDTGDARVDLYALGVMLWELCASKRFLQSDAAVHMAAVARNTMSLPPVAASVGAPPELDKILARLTAFDREVRYQHSRVAAADLAKLLASAKALPNGERGVRARTAHLMQNLFPAEPARSRREFARLVQAARLQRNAVPTAPSPSPNAVAAGPSPEEEGMLPGTRFRLRREIGHGASSIVYEAEHVDLGRRVALKVLGAEHCASLEFAARFRREARAMSRLSHENLVKLLDFGRAEGGRLYCVMELLEGETLESCLSREKVLDWRDALRITLRALRALEVTHGLGVVHRDIKPANLFITKDGGLKLLDFGLAKTPEDVGDAGDVVTDGSRLAGFTLFGTPEYMAPEQASSGRVDDRADLYGLGCVLYEMLTGRLPFAGKSAALILDAKIKGTPERPCERAATRKIPIAVDDFVMRALARHPNLRFQSATEMRQAAEAALDGPSRARVNRRMAGFAAIATLMGFAVVLLSGKAHDLGASLFSPASTDRQSSPALETQAATPPADGAEALAKGVAAEPSSPAAGAEDSARAGADRARSEEALSTKRSRVAEQTRAPSASPVSEADAKRSQGGASSSAKQSAGQAAEPPGDPETPRPVTLPDVAIDGTLARSPAAAPDAPASGSAPQAPVAEAAAASSSDPAAGHPTLTDAKEKDKEDVARQARRKRKSRLAKAK